MRQSIIDKYVGKRYGRLTVTSVHRYREDEDPTKRSRLFMMCDCDCGGCHFVSADSLNKGFTKSCGCIKKEFPAALKHGHSKRDYRSKTYNSWCSMIQRCTNPNAHNYKDYGARGITVCKRWRDSFEAFLNDMGERPEGTTLDRIDVNGNYTRYNCKYSSYSEQNSNKR
ncbi:TPA: hypothetical protein OUD88_002882 [Enterobacter hormaechei]|nr:hypothetical protein [Enterobacter hormaechei]